MVVIAITLLAVLLGFHFAWALNTDRLNLALIIGIEIILVAYIMESLI